MIDLHTHSTASDGTHSPADLVRLAASRGVSVLALTDHDTTAGLLEAQEAARQAGITFVPGIEISVEWPTGEFHLLGLGLRSLSDALRRVIAVLEQERHARNSAMCRKLQEQGVDLSYEEVQAAFGTKNIGRPHFAALMEQKGVVRRRQQAFDQYFAKGRPCYVERRGVELEQAVDAILSSGGLPVQAHPLSLYVAWGRMEETMTEIRRRGVLGLEAWHPGARISEAERLEDMAHRLGMFATGGSDFHGEQVRADRHLGTASGKLHVPARLWEENLRPALEKAHGGTLLPFAEARNTEKICCNPCHSSSFPI